MALMFAIAAFGGRKGNMLSSNVINVYELNISLLHLYTHTHLFTHPPIPLQRIHKGTTTMINVPGNFNKYQAKNTYKYL